MKLAASCCTGVEKAIKAQVTLAGSWSLGLGLELGLGLGLGGRKMNTNKKPLSLTFASSLTMSA